MTDDLACAAALLAPHPAACAIVVEPPGAGIARRLTARIDAGRIFAYAAPGTLGPIDEDLIRPATSLWPGSASMSALRRRRIDTLHAAQQVGLLALHHHGAECILRGAVATIARCIPAVLFDLRGTTDPADGLASRAALLPGYTWPAASPHAAWALPPGVALPPQTLAGPADINVAFDAALAGAGLHAPEWDAPDGGRWTGAGADTYFWMPRPGPGRWMLDLAIADWGNAAGGFSLRADGQRLAPQRVAATSVSYGPFTADQAGGPALLVDLFPPRPVPDHDRWPRKIGLRILAASLHAAPARRAGRGQHG